MKIEKMREQYNKLKDKNKEAVKSILEQMDEDDDKDTSAKKRLLELLKDRK